MKISHPLAALALSLWSAGDAQASATLEAHGIVASAWSRGEWLGESPGHLRQIAFVDAERDDTKRRLGLVRPSGTIALDGASGPFAERAQTTGQGMVLLGQNDSSEFSDRGGVTLTQPLLQPGNSDTSPALRTVDATGSGASSEEAQRDAARLAVQQVAGLYVDARRRIESKITDQAVTEVLEEKILTYTNAYITSLVVTKVEKKDGLVVIAAKVTVKVAPLIKALQSGNIPTVPFDTATAIGQVEVSAREKASAIDLYADLLHRSDTLIKLGVGTPKVNAQFQAPPDQSWLSIPVTFVANGEAIKEWRTKFELIARKRATLNVPVSRAFLNQGTSQPCSVPVLGTDFALNNGETEKLFTGTVTPRGEHGVVACFATSIGATSATLDCFGRRFLDDVRPAPDICAGPACLSFKAQTGGIGMRFDLVDGAGAVVHTIPVNFAAFPMLNVAYGKAEPSPGGVSFFNYCAPDQQPFYALAPRDAAYGDVLVLPPPGSRFRAYGNFLLPNAVIARTASIRLSVVPTSRGIQ